MTELSFEYWNKLANQFILISSLLGGFSLAAVANLLVSERKGGIMDHVLRASIVASAAFIATILAMTEILMKTTKGYPFPAEAGDLLLPRVIGAIAFFVGNFSLIVMISLSGWTRSKELGWFTSVIGFLTFLLMLFLLT